MNPGAPAPTAADTASATIFTPASAATAVRWNAPGLETVKSDAAPAPPSVEELLALEQAAHQEGFARGHAEGFAQGQAELRRLLAQFEGILDSFSRPLARLEDEVVAALSTLAVQVAGALIGRAYAADPILLSELIGEALDAVGGGAREVEVRLHPDDIAALAPLLPMLPTGRLVADQGLARGDLRVHAESVRIDGTLAARLQSALAMIDTGAGP